MRNTIRMNSAAMRENTTPTTTPAIEDNSRMNPPNGLIAIAARPEKMPEMPNSTINADHQPVEGLDDRGRDEAVPLKQILKIEHRWFSRQVEMSANLVPDGTGPSPECCSGQVRDEHRRAVLARGERAMRVGGLRLPQITATIRLPAAIPNPIQIDDNA
mgnify:CR=1 FL=1